MVSERRQVSDGTRTTAPTAQASVKYYYSSSPKLTQLPLHVYLIRPHAPGQLLRLGAGVR